MWLKRTFCGQTSEHVNDDFRITGGHRPVDLNSGISIDSWRDALDHQLESQFVQAGTEIPSYVRRAHIDIKKLVNNLGFQRQAKQD